jgi:hypothetical protein
VRAHTTPRLESLEHRLLLATSSIWASNPTPATPSANDSSSAELGVRFRSDLSGFVTGVRFYKGAGNTGSHIGSLWSNAGQLLGSAAFANETASGWQQVTFASPVAVAANTTYVASYFAPAGHYSFDSAYFAAAPTDAPPLHALQDTTAAHNGLYQYAGASTFPTQTFNGNNYWVDVVFSDTANDTTPPSVVSQTPAPGATNVLTVTAPTATFSESVQSSSISFVLKDPANNTVPGTVSYNDSTRTATFTPAGSLNASTTYTATVSNARDLAGNVMTAPATWSFTTAAPGATYSFWNNTTVPATTASSDGSAVELGLKFRSDIGGLITGIRFYKGAGNTGTHTGSIWSTSGQRLATATFTNETASGWQQVSFTSPLAITANTTYVASYFAPVGHYALNSTFFASAGVDNAPIHALSSPAAGGNGVYAYGGTSSFPSNTFNATNYWVDVVFANGDTTPPSITAKSPAAGATGVPLGTTVTATFDEDVQGGTISLVLRDGGGNTVPGSLNYNNSTRTATLTPTNSLAAATTYTATVSGVADLAGNVMGSPVVWSFTTVASDTQPPSIVARTPAPLATGVSPFVSVTATFDESVQPATISFVLRDPGGNAVPATVSYDAPTRTARLTPSAPLAYLTTYQATLSGAKDLAGNVMPAPVIWSFTTAAPVAVTGLPASGGAGIAPSAKVVAAFDRAMNRATINISTFLLRDPSGASVAARISFNAANNTATLDPLAPLAYSTNYTARVVGGSGGVQGSTGDTMAADYVWSFTTAAAPQQGPGGPILVVTSAANPFSSYYAEILRAEGLNAFANADISSVSTASLAPYDVIVLGEMDLTASQVNVITDWVNAGGNLIAMRPDKDLAGLLGLSTTTNTLSDAYMLTDTASSPGAGITDQTIQFHGTADLYGLSGATRVASIYSSATAATSSPAVTIRDVGVNGGQAAAFTFDLARSIVYTRQGNPAWAGQERDGQAPIRSDDLFYGGTSPDWVDLNKVAIPQADEQQRLLANMITQMNLDNLPLPRLWYLPDGAKAVVLMSGDDHGLPGGTAGRFDAYTAAGQSGGLPIRGSSYVFTTTPLTDAQAAAYTAQGFEIGVHINTNEQNWTPTTLASIYANQLTQWESAYPSLPTPSSHRIHGLVWSDYDTQPQVEFTNRIRLDENYYYYPAEWIQGRPGMFTGSGMPMRFATASGQLIDVYQATTQMTDESGQVYPFTVNTLLDRATGAEGYYGVFTANIHTDTAASAESDAIIASAKAHNAPVMSGRQVLDWLDGRNGTSFGNMSWNAPANTLQFTIATPAGASDVQAMLPLHAKSGLRLTTLSRNGALANYTVQVIKGVEYAFFDANAGSYAAAYAPDTAPPAISALVATTPDTQSAQITWTTDEASDSRIAYGTSPGALTLSATGAGGATSHHIVLSGLTPGQTYYYRVNSTDAAGNTAISPAAQSGPATFTVPANSTFTLWNDSVVPAVTASSDASAVEVGVKFNSDTAGSLTGLRFYKGTGNTGSHVAHLWSSGGQLLATATFSGETASGWQTVTFPSPVAIAANTTYVASYYAPVGHYAVTNGYFANAVDSGPLHALANTQAGGNGVYRYGTGGGFPTGSFNSSNYWVDVVFSNVPPPPPPQAWSQTTVADFNAAGASQTGTAVTNRLGGEIALAQATDDFNGTALGAAWTTTSWEPVGGGPTNVTVSGGVLSIAGAEVRSNPTTSATPVEARLTFGATPFQHFGLATDVSAVGGNFWAMFSTMNTTNTLFARINANGSTQDVNLGALPAGYHVYRVQPVAGAFEFYVDGALRTSLNASFATGIALRAMASAYSGAPSPSLLVDSITYGTFASNGVFTSSVFDAGHTATWGNVNWTAAVPAGSSMVVEVRSGNTATPDGSWSAWSSVTSGGPIGLPSSRYLQYRITFVGSDPNQTPTLFDIQFMWS